jgi:hypothetical protein
MLCLLGWCRNGSIEFSRIARVPLLAATRLPPSTCYVSSLTVTLAVEHYTVRHDRLNHIGLNFLPCLSSLP